MQRSSGAPYAVRFRSLLLLLRGRAALTQRDIANLIGVSERAVQVWEAGDGYPSAPTLQRLIAAYIRAGALGRQPEEAVALWAAAAEGGPRFKAAFDPKWFAGLLEDYPAAADKTASNGNTSGVTARGRSTQPVASRADWGEAPAVDMLYGRQPESKTLLRWLTEDECRLVGIFGMGGIGKTALAAQIAQSIWQQFDVVFWRALRSGPSPDDWLASAILFVSDQQIIPPQDEEARGRLLLDLLRQRRCLLVLDNLETLLEPGTSEVRYRDGYVRYGAILQLLGEATHQSCVVITSREVPPELRRLAGNRGPVRALHLRGLDEAAGRALLATKALHGGAASWPALVGRYGGNALALQVVGEAIASVFGSSIDGFLAADEAVFGDIRRVLDWQFSRLSPLERSVLYWLAIEREPVSFDVLAADIGPGTPRHQLLEALEALSRRSLLERGDGEATFTVQSVVLEYATEQLIATACAEIANERPELLVSHALIKAEALEYVRRGQQRLIAAPLLARLAAACVPTGVERRVIGMLDRWRGCPDVEQGYGPGNLVNLLRLAQGHLRGLDLSHLSLRQVDFVSTEMHDANLAGARVTDSRFSSQIGSAMCLALSGDGACVAVGTLTGEVRVWRLADRMPVMLVQQPTGAAWDVAISADGSLVASCGADSALLWRIGAGASPLVLRTPGREAWRVALSADGRIVASAAGDGTTRLWDTRTGECLRVLECHAGGVRGLALSQRGHLLCAGGPDGVVRVWDTATGQQLSEFSGASGDARALAMSSDGNVIACGDAEGQVHVWDRRTTQRRWSLRGHTGPVFATALTADGGLLASGGADRTLRVWNTRTGRCRSILHDHSAGVIGASLDAEGKLAASVTSDGVVQVREARRGHCFVLAQGSVAALFEVAASADGAWVVSGGGDGDVRVWDASAGRCARVLKGHTEGVWAVALTHDGRLAASGGLDGMVRLWSASTGECLATLRGHAAPVWSVALSADGHVLASSGLDGTFRVWNTETYECVRVQQCGLAGVRSIRMSADGHMLVSSEFDGAVRVWDAQTGECRGMLGVPNGEAGRLAVSADGRLVALADLKGCVQLWDARELARVGTIQAQQCGVRGVGLSANAGLLATAGVDGSVGLWSTEDRRQLGLLRGHVGEVWDVAISADGRAAVSGGLDGTVRVWDTRGGGKALSTMRPDRPYERVNITGIEGLTEAQRGALLALGALDRTRR